MLPARGILDGVKNKEDQAEQKAEVYKDKAKGNAFEWEKYLIWERFYINEQVERYINFHSEICRLPFKGLVTIYMTTVMKHSKPLPRQYFILL